MTGVQTCALPISNEGESKEVKEAVEDIEEDIEETEEKETPEESSTENKPDESEEEETKEEVDDSEKEKEIAGLEKELEKLDKDNSLYDEKIRELRELITEKRSQRREKKNLMKDVEIPPEEESNSLSDIDQETLNILDRYTKAKGLVPISEVEKRLYATEHTKAEQRFYDRHPEYKPENDVNDTLYTALSNELSLFVQPKSPVEIEKVFEKAHKLVQERYPSKFKPSRDSSKDITKEERIKKARLGSSGGGATPTTKNSKINSKQVEILRSSGWSEEDIKELI